MALVEFNKSPSSNSYFQKTVTLVDWWLTKPKSNDDTNTIGVAGLTSHQTRASRCFSSAPILKIFDLFELETVDGVCIILQGFINRGRTVENGFSTEVFDHFLIGFPHNWREFTTSSPKTESSSECVTKVQTDVKDSIEEHDDFDSKKQSCDSDTVDMGVKVCEDLMLSNKTITPVNQPSVEISQEQILETENEVLCEKSPVTPGFEGDLSHETSPIVSNAVDSCTGSKRIKASRRCTTRSVTKLDNSKHGFSSVNDMSNFDKETPADFEIFRMKLRRKQFDQHVDVVTPMGRKGISVEGKNKDDDDGCRNKKKSRVNNVSQKQDEINLKEKIVTRSKSKSKMSVKRKLIPSPKSARSTFSSVKKGTEERCKSANILSLESFSGKKSRSGRVVLPPLEFWRNQKVVYDEDGQMCGVQEPK